MDAHRQYQSFLVRYYAGVAKDLPMISPYARELVGKPRSSIPSLRALTAAFQTDPFLAAKITGASNSIFYARDHQAVLTISEALQKVGYRYARNLLREAPRLPSGIDGAHIALLWAHCMAVAHTAKAIASAVPSAPLEPDVAYLVGMIHDIGYVLQLQYSPNTLTDIVAQLKQGEAGADNTVHASQGEELARFWFLPTAAIAAIKGHHAPQTCADREGRWLSLVIAVSERLAGRELTVADAAVQETDDELLVALSIPEEVLPRLRSEAARVFEECLERCSWVNREYEWESHG